jgi:hypothetical protein
MFYKTTTRLFKGIYQYKIVLVVAGAGHFRSGDMDATLETLSKIDLATQQVFRYSIKTQEDLNYAKHLALQLAGISDIDVRVESPWISIYSNNEADINALANIDLEKVKYISKPPANQTLSTGTIILPKMDYDYRVTLGKTVTDHLGFITWAEKSDKLRLTKSCVKDLSKPRSWGGTHFYVTGDNNLLMAKMHLGGAISKVERIIKA